MNLAGRPSVKAPDRWPISDYNAKGYFEPNPLDAYTLNNMTGKKAADRVTRRK